MVAGVVAGKGRRLPLNMVRNIATPWYSYLDKCLALKGSRAVPTEARCNHFVTASSFHARLGITHV
jgi:hypothetical protein